MSYVINGLSEQFAQSHELEQKMKDNLKKIGYEI